MPYPSKRTPELVAAILSGMSKGKTLASMCREHDIDQSTWNDWCTRDEALGIARDAAKQMGFDAIADDALSIADERDEDPASRRVMVDTRLKLLAKWDPKRYGDKLGIGGADGLDPVKLAVSVKFIGD